MNYDEIVPSTVNIFILDVTDWAFLFLYIQHNKRCLVDKKRNKKLKREKTDGCNAVKRARSDPLLQILTDPLYLQLVLSVLKCRRPDQLIKLFFGREGTPARVLTTF